MHLGDQILAELEGQARQDLLAAKRRSHPSGYWHMGIPTAAVRKLARQSRKAFASLTWPAQAALAQRLLDYGSDEASHLSVFMLGGSIRTATQVDAVVLDRMVGAFRGWSVTDAFCIEVLQPLLAAFPSDTLTLTQGWASAVCRWKRRASVVLFTRKIGESGHYTELGLAACERLIDDTDDLVRKGIGWALKDLMRGDREQVLAYVADLRKRGAPSVITLYALRDVRGPERQRLMAIKGSPRG